MRFSKDTKALADSTPQLIATSGADQIKEAADKVTEGSKKIIRGTENKVKEAANTNAAKVDQADDDGGIAESKAMRDKNRIERKALSPTRDRFNLAHAIITLKTAPPLTVATTADATRFRIILG